jgi:3'-phosphoadenosine 5'-phosphosulfate sulfotransferase (PAPS reductase)/FAD synthetase
MTDFKNTPELSEITKPAISYSTCYASFLYVVLFSGGRTSAFLAKYMKEHPHYKNCLFVFMNTGKEREETLQFADKCDKEFELNLVY